MDMFITAYTWMYGCTRKDAIKAYRESDPERINLIIDAVCDNAKRSFCND